MLLSSPGLNKKRRMISRICSPALTKRESTAEFAAGSVVNDLTIPSGNSQAIHERSLILGTVALRKVCIVRSSMNDISRNCGYSFSGIDASV